MEISLILLAMTTYITLPFVESATVRERYGLRNGNGDKWTAFFVNRNYKIRCSEARDHHWANCQKFKETGMCRTHWYNMETYCPKTCKFCFEDRAQAPTRCEKSKYGCCEDQKTPAKGPKKLGCPENCHDSKNFDCPYHAKKGYCVTHYSSMRRRCPKSCNYCNKGLFDPCMDYWQEATCKMLARFGTCKSWSHKMGKYCMKTCRVCTAAAPELQSVASDCSMSGKGCCWDRKTPLSRGCPACKDVYGPMFCKRFKMECKKIDRVNGIQIRIFCPETCGLCNRQKCEDDIAVGNFCEDWKERGHCENNPLPMGVYCRKTCKFCR